MQNKMGIYPITSILQNHTTKIYQNDYNGYNY